MADAIPAGPEAITPAWLTAALRDGDALDASSAVVRVAVLVDQEPSGAVDVEVANHRSFANSRLSLLSVGSVPKKACFDMSTE